MVEEFRINVDKLSHRTRNLAAAISVPIVFQSRPVLLQSDGERKTFLTAVRWTPYRPFCTLVNLVGLEVLCNPTWKKIRTCLFHFFLFLPPLSSFLSFYFWCVTGDRDFDRLSSGLNPSLFSINRGRTEPP